MATPSFLKTLVFLALKRLEVFACLLHPVLPLVALRAFHSKWFVLGRNCNRENRRSVSAALTSCRSHSRPAHPQAFCFSAILQLVREPGGKPDLLVPANLEEAVC